MRLQRERSSSDQTEKPACAMVKAEFVVSNRSWANHGYPDHGQKRILETDWSANLSEKRSTVTTDAWQLPTTQAWQVPKMCMHNSGFLWAMNSAGFGRIHRADCPLPICFVTDLFCHFLSLSSPNTSIRTDRFHLDSHFRIFRAQHAHLCMKFLEWRQFAQHQFTSRILEKLNETIEQNFHRYSQTILQQDRLNQSNRVFY